MLAAEVEVADRYGIPHSEFLAWDKTDRDKALWARARRKAACPGCGTRPAEWDPARGGDVAAYTAVASTCPGCRAIADADERLDKASRATHVQLQPAGR